MANKNILLIEPGYRNKYPPLGLMKLAQYHGPQGKGDNVRFIKGEDRSVIGTAWDRIYITTLFSFEWTRTARSIDFALEVAHGRADLVFVGGIAASLMHDKFLEEPRWRGIRFIQGLLVDSPAESLQLDEFDEELYSEDRHSGPIEEMLPDYSILGQISYRYPVHDAYFLYASRGCIRTCSFCGVPKLEGGQRDTPSITKLVNGIEARYGQKKDLIFMDNNIVASEKFADIISEVVDLGFGRGATIRKRGIQIMRRVDFNQGVDARELAKNGELMKQIARTCISPLRIAFDHLGLRKQYETSIRMAADNGIKGLSNYMLYNYNDDPADLYDRMHLNVQLNEELNIRIFSFPMRYHPVDQKDRSFVGKHWNRYQIRSMQVILQATHGIVSGSPDFFREAFGESSVHFLKLLSLPHHFIFNRMWYFKGDGRSEYDEFLAQDARLSDEERSELAGYLCTWLFENDGDRLTRAEIRSKVEGVANPKLQAILSFYIPLEKDVERVIWDKQKELRKLEAPEPAFNLPEDEVVEDAGLMDDGDSTEPSPRPAALAR
ncbi:hypothetical protein [Mesoterricola silvestris]|uniref:Radical SAM protein n=1 Tax=Mesoterricola silvestris TaxID=2927979 RepID=A0AA48K9U5_9BACT|nr:hypothetical protein [Mesoterricola silvestris]BDU70853.1 hypothetical protein METEAL_00270 [Mesoterricola silvestris]